MGFPTILYHYCPFSSRALDMLYKGEIYGSDPVNFNDPLDCRASINPDISTSDLEKILFNLIKRRISIELKQLPALKSIFQKHKDLFIEKCSNASANSAVSRINYDSKDEDAKTINEDYKKRTLVKFIESEVQEFNDVGVFCLSENWNSALMWSHYGDKHRGICIGYETDVSKESLYKVDYNGPREFKASDLLGSFEGDKDARIRLHKDTLLRKANPWKYEHEWRYIGKKGGQVSPFKIISITFGCKSSRSIIPAVVSNLKNNKGKPIDFYRIYIPEFSFELKQEKLAKEDLAGTPVNSYEERRSAKKIWGEDLVFTSRDEQDPLCPPYGHD